MGGTRFVRDGDKESASNLHRIIYFQLLYHGHSRRIYKVAGKSSGNLNEGIPLKPYTYPQVVTLISFTESTLISWHSTIILKE